MKVPSSTSAIKNQKEISALRIMLLSISTIFLLIYLWFYKGYQSDPFIKNTLDINGSIETGNKLFRMNCVGCHGISAQGLVGPNLHEVTFRLNDPQIINQVVKGKTPPMPKFEIDSNSMADLLAYMHSLPQT